MRRLFAGVFFGIALITVALGQGSGAASSVTPPAAAKPIAWDVVSVKPNHSLDFSGGMRITPNGIDVRNMPIRSIFINAFSIVSSDQLIGAPGWIDTDHYDIQAKMDSEASAAFHQLKGAESLPQWRALWRQILEDRFGLKYHTDKRELPVYNLVIAKHGLKMKESAPEENGGSSAGPGRITGKKGGITNIAYGLSGTVGRLIIDKTGLTGKYDYDLTWSPDSKPDSGPSIFTALEEQLGLKLEPGKASVDVVVIDHLERPSEN